MTVGAILGGGHMAGGFTDRHQAVVAGRAVIHNAGMIKHPSGKAAGLMADTAIFGGGHVVELLADGLCSIMTRGTVIHDTRVIKHRTNKGSSVMTDTTILAGGNVRCRFANGGRAIMAGRAVTTDSRMIENRRQECRGGMTEVTILCRGQMVCCRILTGGKLPVMTPVTATGHAGMIKHPGSKTAGDMTHRTIIRGGNMIHRFADGLCSVMTGGAVIHDAGVIKHRG